MRISCCPPVFVTIMLLSSLKMSFDLFSKEVVSSTRALPSEIKNYLTIGDADNTRRTFRFFSYSSEIFSCAKRLRSTPSLSIFSLAFEIIFIALIDTATIKGTVLISRNKISNFVLKLLDNFSRTKNSSRLKIVFYDIKLRGNFQENFLLFSLQVQVIITAQKDGEVMNRRKFLSLIGASFFVTFFAGCGESSSSNEKTLRGDFFVEDVKLNSGYSMPVLGLGTWTLNDAQAESCVYHALKVGYRLIDTARYYGNEIGVGRGVRKAIADKICEREKIFVTSKIMPSNYSAADAAIENSLADLDIGYVDLMLIHQPGANDEQAYKSLARAAQSDKVRSIGISNYYTPRDFDRMNKIFTPAVVQNENHIYNQNNDLQNYLKNFGAVVEAWYPFGGRGNTQKIFSDTVILELAKVHGKTSAQIILRWQIQAGYIAVPGSKNPKHIEENFNIFDFELSAEEMKKIFALNKNHRFENW